MQTGVPLMTQPSRTLIAGNWKMNGSGPTAETLAASVSEAATGLPAHIELTVCPPFTLLDRIGRILTDGPVALGAQDCHVEKSGAFTGDIAAPMLADMGVRYVILGHSERRRDHAETDALVCAKAESAAAAGLTPIICIGETLEERDEGRAHHRLSEQIIGSVPKDFDGVIAYEPIWAIGTGRSASRDDIIETTAHIRHALATHLHTGDKTPRILYGGSVKPQDAESILSIETVNGVLVGGASLAAESFIGIARGAPKA